LSGGVKPSPRRESDMPADLLRSLFGNVKVPVPQKFRLAIVSASGHS
jgi:hypothetical protein